MGTDGELRDDATGRVALKDVRKVTLQESCVGNSEKNQRLRFKRGDLEL